jgi:hypothetical protein
MFRVSVYSTAVKPNWGLTESGALERLDLLASSLSIPPVFLCSLVELTLS